MLFLGSQKNVGSVTLLVLVMLISFVIVTTASIQLISRQSHQTIDQEQREQAFGLADAGVQYTLWLLGGDGGEMTTSDLCTSPPSTVVDHAVTDASGETLGTFTLQYLSATPTSVILRSVGRDAVKPELCQVVDATLTTLSGGFQVTDWQQVVDYDCDEEIEQSISVPLMGHWKLEETYPPGLKIDSSGNGNHGTPYRYSGTYPQPSTIVPPLLPESTRSLDMNQHQMVRLYDKDGFSVEHGTFAAWARPTSAGGSLFTHLTYPFANRIYITRTPSSTGLNYTLGSTSGTINNVFTLIEWAHITVVWDRPRLRVYKNGQKILDRGYGGQLDTVGHLTIGGNPIFSDNSGWRGQMDDVRIYTDALSDEEIFLLAQGSGDGAVCQYSAS